MTNDYLLDTNTAIYYLNGDIQVTVFADRQTLRYLPFITAAELLYGAKRSARRQENLHVCLEFLSRFFILYPGRQTVETHSDLRVTLKDLGRPIPAIDLWLAALSLEHDAILVTNDKHFTVVPGLRTENWFR